MVSNQSNAGQGGQAAKVLVLVDSEDKGDPMAAPTTANHKRTRIDTDDEGAGDQGRVLEAPKKKR